jgi:hypothetical protein
VWKKICKDKMNIFFVVILGVFGANRREVGEEIIFFTSHKMEFKERSKDMNLIKISKFLDTKPVFRYKSRRIATQNIGAKQNSPAFLFECS